MTIPHNPFEAVKFCRELFSAKVALRGSLQQADFRESEAKSAYKSADASLLKANSGAFKLVELRKWQAASDVSLQELTVDLKEVKSQLVKVTAEKLELSATLNVVEAESDNIPEQFSLVRGTGDGVKEFVPFVVCQSVEALDLVINQDKTQLLDRFHTGQGVYTVSQLLYSITLKDVSGVWETILRVQGPTSCDGADGNGSNASVPTLALPKSLIPPSKRSCGRSKTTRL